MKECNNANHILVGASYFKDGLKMLWRQELRKYILVPLVVNIFLFVTLTALLINFITSLTFNDTILPEWLRWLSPLVTWGYWILWTIISILALVVYAYSFNLITNIIAAPFYGMLAEQAEILLTGKPLPQEPLNAMIPRVMSREIRKLLYFLIRGLFITLVVILLGTIPLLNIVALLIGGSWAAWTMSIQYVDYPADNHQLKFRELRGRLGKKFYSSMGFGGIVMGCSVIPILNLIAMPAAVIGGTIFWLNELRECEKIYIEE